MIPKDGDGKIMHKVQLNKICHKLPSSVTDKHPRHAQ